MGQTQDLKRVMDALNPDRPKIFCHQCKYYRSSEFGDGCWHPDSIEEDYRGRRKKRQNPRAKNISNLCGDYKPKWSLRMKDRLKEKVAQWKSAKQ